MVKIQFILGYLRLTDLGIARIWKPDNENDTSGTPGYMAPEVMCRQNHGVASDYFAVGIIAYECMMGKVLKYLKNRDHIQEKQERKLEIKYQLNKSKSNQIKYQMDGLKKQLILLTKLYKENQ